MRQAQWLTLLAATLLGASAWAAEPKQRVVLGVETLARSGFKALAGKKVGLITNPSGMDGSLNPTLDVLRGATNFTLAALFGPEHGIYGDIPAGDKVANRVDKRTGLTVHSLYGATRKPTPEMLKGLDALVFDIQDIGSRSYTYISTMGLAMEACGEAGIEFVVLDRPNPLGGERIEGPLVKEPFRSFVSQWDIPYVHGLTMGELARMIHGEKWIKQPGKLTVIPMGGWRRSMIWEETGLAWVPTSPHIPSPFSPRFYAATGILGELGLVSIGVGYTLPFQCVAMPDLDPHAFAAALNKRRIPGVVFKPITYRPYYAIFKETVISGVQIHLTDPRSAPLMPLNFYLLEELNRATKRNLLVDASKAGKSMAMFDKVTGSDGIRLALERGTSAAALVESFKPVEESFRKLRAKYLLYR